MSFSLFGVYYVVAGLVVFLILLGLFYRLNDRALQRKVLGISATGILALAACLLLFYFLGGQAVSAKRMGGEALVALSPASMRHFEYGIEGLGTAEANEAVTITSQVSERVAEVLFTEGQQVKKGDLLVQLEDREMKAGLEEMEVELAREQLEYERQKTLRDKKIISQKEMDEQNFALSVAKARVLIYKSKVRDRKIIVPFDGIVGIRLVSPGALVTPGEKITTLDDLATIKLKFSIPEIFLSSLKVGQGVRATASAYPDREFTGKISVIDTRVDAATRAVAVQAAFDNKDRMLKPGMLMTVDLISKPRESLALPERCLLSFAKRHYVFVVGADKKAERREIKIGQRDYGFIEVLSGLKEGEKVVVDGIALVKAGDLVRVAQSTEAASPVRPEGKSTKKVDPAPAAKSAAGGKDAQ